MGTLAINLRPAEASGVGGLTRKSAHTDLLPLEYLVAAEPSADYTAVAPPDAAITGRIHIIRGQKIMLDRDLAELYGVETKHLKRQVRRNLGRFPEDFMFELTAAEWATLRYQFGTSKDEMLSERGGSRVLPMAFTEQGVAMLSSVLNSEQAILVNIHIIRVFSRTCLPAGARSAPFAPRDPPETGTTRGSPHRPRRGGPGHFRSPHGTGLPSGASA